MKYTASQDKAIHHEGENILVSASAGSGKTGVLKARVLRKIKDGVDIDRLIVLTFTEAAAAEMKSRIIDELNHKGLDEQLIKLDNAIISTFDAFTLRLVRTYHYLLDLPSDIEISDALLIEMESQKILDQVIKGFYESDDPHFKALVKRLFSGNDYFLNQAILSLAKAIKKIPNYQSVLDDYSDIYDDAMAEEAHQRYFQVVHQELTMLSDKFKSYVHDNHGVFSVACDEYLRVCQGIYDALGQAQTPDQIIALITSFSLPKKPRKPRGEDHWLESNDAIKKQVKAIKNDMEEAHLIDGDYLQSWHETRSTTKVMLDMVKAYLNQMKDIQREKHLYSFDDIMSFAIQLFEDNDVIRNHYKHHINELLIDEYQDTNDLQDYLIALIANKNVFMVGDVKQSIYRFRDANPKNFMRLLAAYQNHDGGKAIRLLENFRSNRFLLETINQFFLKQMTKQRGGVDYHDHHQLVSGYPEDHGLNLKNDPLHTHFYDIDAILIDHPDMTKDDVEAHIVANDIRRKIKQRQAVFDGKNNRPINYDDITILVDRKTAFNAYASVLSTYAIPVEIYDKTLFSESEEIIFLTEFLKLLEGIRHHQLQGLQTALYSVSRSFVYQIPDQTIIAFFLRTQGDYEDLKTYAPLKKVFSDLEKIAAMIDQIPNIKLLEVIYRQVNLYNKIGYLSDLASKSRKLDFFYGLVEKQKDKSFADLINYLVFIQEQPNIDIEYTDQRLDHQAVKMMSIHQSKGLQFPVIYMMGLHKKFNFQENKDPFNFSKEYGILTYANQAGIFRHYLERLYFKQIKKEDLSEKIRLMYVALTRSKEEINLVLQAKESLNLDKINPSNYLEMLYDGLDLKVKDTITHLVVAKPPQTQFTHHEDQQITYKHFDFQAINTEAQAYSKTEKTLFSPEEKKALAYGEAIHESLEMLDYHDLKSSMKTLPLFIQKSIRDLVKTDIFQSLKSPSFYQEYTFVDFLDGRQTTGVIDLLIEDDNQLVIIDYKLKEIDDPAYDKQIKGYQRYLKTMSHKPIKGFLYSLVQHRLKEVL